MKIFKYGLILLGLGVLGGYMIGEVKISVAREEQEAARQTRLESSKALRDDILNKAAEEKQTMDKIIKQAKKDSKKKEKEALEKEKKDIQSQDDDKISSEQLQKKIDRLNKEAERILKEHM